MQNDVKKYSIIGIVIILLILLGAFALLVNNAEKNSTSAVIPPISFSENTNPDENTSPENHEVVPVRELTGYEDAEGFEKYMETDHPCHLEGSNPTQYSAIGYISEQHTIYGKKFYLSKISLKKGEYLSFSLLYKDEAGIEQVWLNFESTSVEEVSFLLRENRVRKQVSYFSYSGCLTNPNDTEYERCNGKNVGITAIERSNETREFALEGAFFSSNKKEVSGSEIDSWSSYRLVIKH